ncbi:MAG: DUF6689 family protein [Thermoanaerobaculia bacterium]
MKASLYWILTAALALPAAADDGIADITIEGNQVHATLDLGAGIAADLTLTFEQVVGLTESSLGLSAELVNPLDQGILSRLPDPSQASIPASFPVRLAIEPPAGGALTFSGVTQLELYTHNLSYGAGTPLRLVSAPLGGTFRDVSAYMGTGSYRVRGSQGGFSEFLIIADLRPSAAVIGDKFDHLDQLLAAHADAIEPQTLAELEQLFAAAEGAWLANDRVTAIDFIEEFTDVVSQHSGEDIPDVWRATRDLTNIAGLLRADAATLRFSLNL